MNPHYLSYKFGWINISTTFSFLVEWGLFTNEIPSFFKKPIPPYRQEKKSDFSRNEISCEFITEINIK